MQCLQLDVITDSQRVKMQLLMLMRPYPLLYFQGFEQELRLTVVTKLESKNRFLDTSNSHLSKQFLMLHSIVGQSSILPIASIEVNLMFQRCIFLLLYRCFKLVHISSTCYLRRCNLKLHQFWHRTQQQTQNGIAEQNLMCILQ